MSRHLEAATPIRARAGFFGRWRTMGVIGIRMMFHDRLKLAGTLFGVVFAVVLGNFQVGTFLALLFKNRMFVENAQVDVWIAPPGTRQFQTGTPLTDQHLNRARAMAGVAWAEPLLLRSAAPRENPPPCCCCCCTVLLLLLLPALPKPPL